MHQPVIFITQTINNIPDIKFDVILYNPCGCDNYKFWTKYKNEMNVSYEAFQEKIQDYKHKFAFIGFFNDFNNTTDDIEFENIQPGTASVLTESEQKMEIDVEHQIPSISDLLVLSKRYTEFKSNCIKQIKKAAADGQMYLFYQVNYELDKDLIERLSTELRVKKYRVNLIAGDKYMDIKWV